MILVVTGQHMHVWASYSIFFQVLISRNYKGDIETSAIEKFNSLLLEKEEDSNYTTPILQADGVTFAYIKYNNVYCILSKINAHAFVVSTYLL